jgi:lysophospholipase L1-like esterase
VGFATPGISVGGLWSADNVWLGHTARRPAGDTRGDSEISVRITGATAISLRACIFNAGDLDVYVNGALQDPSGNGGAWATIPLAGSFDASATYYVTLKSRSNLWLDSSAFLILSGPNPTTSTPPDCGPQYVVSSLTARPYATQVAALTNIPNFPAYQAAGAQCTFHTDARILEARVNVTSSTNGIRLWMNPNGGGLRLMVDGAYQALDQLPLSGALGHLWRWVNIGAGLAPGQHVITLWVCSTISNEAYPPNIGAMDWYRVMFYGMAPDTTWAPPSAPAALVLGDSITYGMGVNDPTDADLDTSLGWFQQVTVAEDRAMVNWGIPGESVYDIVQNGAASKRILQYEYPQLLAALSGKSALYVWLGTNDITAGNLTPDQFQGCVSRLIGLIRSHNRTAEILFLGILHRANGTPNLLVDAYNAAIQAAVARSDSRVGFVKTADWIDPRTDLDADGVHPNLSGAAKIAAKWKSTILRVSATGVVTP